MIDPVTGWFEVTKYREKTAITIKTLVKTMCLAWYPCPVEITYDQGGEFLGHEFKDSMIENEYGIKTKPAYPGNPQANSFLERIYQVLGNIVRTYNQQETYVDDADPSMGILSAAAFVVRFTYHTTRLGPSQDVHFFYTRSHLSALQSYGLIFSTNFHLIFILK